MHQPPLLSLSPELILFICEKLNLTDLKQLRLSCKAISRVTDSLVLRNLSISAEGASVDEALSYLHLLEQGPARYIAQEIVIRDLSSLSRSTTSSKGSGRPRSALRNEGVREKIKQALESLTRVRHVTWHPNENDTQWLQKTIWDVIQSFSAMRHLSICYTYLKFLPTFHTLTNLESISIDAARAKISWVYTSLSKLYASSGTLTSISIRDGSGYQYLSKANNLDQIFSAPSRHASQSGLRRLNLHDCFVSINKLTLPHLRQLTSLELVCRKHRHWGDPNMDGNPHDIWTTFTASGIQLEELVHNTTVPSLIDYLSTYSGLKKLNLKVSPFIDQSSSDETAIRFFDTVLPRHLDTLENLGLEAYYEGKWAYTLRNAALIKRCTHLNRLLMSIMSDRSCILSESDERVDGKRQVGWSDYRRNVVKHFLDTTIHLPCLSYISLLPAYPESSRDSRCGTGRIRHYRWSKAEITKKVMSYHPPVSCWYIPEVEVCGTAFEVVRHHGQLGYEAI